VLTGGGDNELYLKFNLGSKIFNFLEYSIPVIPGGKTPLVPPFNENTDQI